MTDGMRILMVAPTPYFSDRGCHVRIYEEARALKARGHDVRIATYHLGRDMPEILTLRTISVPWYRKLSAGPSWHKPYLDILLFFRAWKEIRRFRPHLIHCHLHEGAFIGIFLKLVTGIPFLFDCQGSLTTEIADHGFLKKDSLLLRLFGVIERWVNGQAGFIVTSSTAGEAELREKWQVPSDRVRALIDGVDTAVFTPERHGSVRQNLGLPADVPVIAYLGVLSRYQGIDLLLESAVRLRDRGVPCRFLVMGYPEEAYRRQAAEMGLSDTVVFTGRLDYARAPEYLAAADVAVSAKISLTEANGKLFNYMACGVATVAFDTPVNREILGNAGSYAAYGDAEDLAWRIEELVLDASRRQELGELARQRAVDVHSWSKRGEELEGLYRQVLRLLSGTRP